MRKRLAVIAREPAAAVRAARRLLSTTTNRVRLAPAAVVHWPRERSARRAGEAAWGRGDEQAAYAHFEQATRDGTNQWSWLRFARSAMRRDRAGIAYDAMARALEIAPGSLSVRPEVVNLLAHRGYRDEREALAAAPRTRGLEHGRRASGPIPGRAAHAAGRPPATSDGYWAWFDDARRAIDRDDIETACASILHALHVAPSSPSVCLEFASLLNALGDGEIGLGLLTGLEHGFTADAAALVARALVRRQMLVAAREIAARSAAQGRDLEAVVFEAAVLYAEGRSDDARALIAQHTDARAIALALGHVALDSSEVVDAWHTIAPIADFANLRLLLRFVRRLDARGQLVLAKEVAAIADSRPNGGKHALRWNRACDRKLDALAHGLHLPSGPPDEQYEPDAKSVFYLLHNSLPYMSAGYASRTHGLLSALVERGRRVQGVTRPGFPYDMLDDPTQRIDDADTIDDVTYLRIGEPRRYARIDIVEYFEEYVALLEPIARREQIGLVHAASNYWNGLAANVLRDRLGIPSIYEVRGLWEVTQHSRQPEFGATEGYQLQVLLETQAAQEADAVITITHALRHEMARRGVAEEKMIVVPNGVDTDRFTPLPRDEQLEAELGLAGKRVIGFVGSLVDYEGLDLLLRAAARLRRTHDDFHIVLVGRGAGADDLRALTSELALDDIVTFTGRVPHAQVERYLSVIDITPFPRHALPVCEMVSPLKPLESMATGKLVIASNVAALAEMVDDGVTGLLFEKESLDDLTRVLGRALDDGELRRQLTATARPWVERERSWAALSGRVEALYETLLAGVPLRGGS